ncbi:spore coat protein CotJB [Anaerofilum sp. BX8]|uniref:Spore coat protein CotJB n=1 Tax=Anaerofilum hominis TaxID=2763016 RepID=A0A923KXW7_9FIRM|nr:spore coat protein CotJB [Anaerofilum hominis]MBC5581169.1 spore coat protein CotJB [Anaerofilum hominis]
MNEANSLFDSIVKVSFAMDEIRLFLDTHPQDEEALSAYDKLRGQREALVRRYTESCGPINFYDAGGSCEWNWVQQPWPWEKEA